MPSVISGDANVSATEFGFLDGVTSGLQSQINSKLNLAGGKILQIVRATDTTNRSTTSTSYVDVTGCSVTITPQRNDSAVIVICNILGQTQTSTAGGARAYFRLTDSANNAMSAAGDTVFGTINYTFTGTADMNQQLTIIGYATPATTAATTYKLRFRSEASTTTTFCLNGTQGAQLLAFEVSA